MNYMDAFWPTLGIITPVLLLIYWQKRNAVWGGFTLGILVGFVIALVLMLSGHGFNWLIVGKAAAIGTMTGFFSELLGKISDKHR